MIWVVSMVCTTVDGRSCTSVVPRVDALGRWAGLGKRICLSWHELLHRKDDSALLSPAPRKPRHWSS
jgi:hypothetical protein